MPNDTTGDNVQSIANTGKKVFAEGLNKELQTAKKAIEEEGRGLVKKYTTAVQGVSTATEHLAAVKQEVAEFEAEASKKIKVLEELYSI